MGRCTGSPAIHRRARRRAQSFPGFLEFLRFAYTALRKRALAISRYHFRAASSQIRTLPPPRGPRPMTGLSQRGDNPRADETFQAFATYLVKMTALPRRDRAAQSTVRQGSRPGTLHAVSRGQSVSGSSLAET